MSEVSGKLEIEVGDQVRVFFHIELNCLNGIVNHIPVATGDAWRLTLFDGRLVYVQNYAYIELVESPHPDREIPF